MKYCPACGLRDDLMNSLCVCQKPNDPTPEEIREHCRRFQASWSADERRRRERIDNVPWGIPELADPMPMEHGECYMPSGGRC